MVQILSGERLLKLSVIDGTKPKSSTGLVDTRLFTGENHLRAIMDPETCLWYMRYDDGGLPTPLKQRFTSFNRLLQHAQAYFKGRNIKVEQ